MWRCSIGSRFDCWVTRTMLRTSCRMPFARPGPSRHLFDPARSERAWLLAILRRRAADHWRRSNAVVRPGMGELPQPAAPLGRDPFADELSSAMQRALGRLPEELRETLLLVVVGGLTHQEAADLQGVPLGTVLSRVSRARSRLREFLLESPAAVSARQ